MFDLTDQPAKLAHVNVRGEKHGDEMVTACDLSIQFDASNDVLTAFGPQLRAALFAKAAGGKKAEQGELDGLAAISDLPHLRTPEIEFPIRIRYEGVGYTATIDYGLGESSNIEFSDCKVNGIKVECREGGSVTVNVRVQVKKPDAVALGKVCGMIGHEIDLTLKAPEADGKLAA